MRLLRNWHLTLKRLLFFGAMLFPLFWLVIGGFLRTPLLIVSGIFGLYVLRQRRLHKRVRTYAQWMLLGAFLAIMGFVRSGSESEVVSPPMYVLLIFYAVPAGILIAHSRDECKDALNWICACMMMLFAFWSYLVMGQVDLSQIVRMGSNGVTRGDQLYPAQLFGIFTWENVKMQLIPWCAYPFGAVIAVACRGPVLMRGMLVVGAAVSGYVSGAFLTRSVFLAGGIAIAAVILVFMVKADRKSQFVMVVTVLLLAVGIAAVIQTVPIVKEFVNGLTDRFSNTSDDERQYLWASSCKLIVSHPFGGGDALLEEHLWAHNLPLDMGLLYGVPGLVSMTCLLGLLSAAVAKWILQIRGEIELFEITLLSVFISALVSCMISPPDPSYLAPLIFVGVFAKERGWIDGIRARTPRQNAALPSPMLSPSHVSS